MYFSILTSLKLDLVILCFFDSIFKFKISDALDGWSTVWNYFYITAHTGLLVLQTPSLKWGWCSRLSAYFCFMLLEVGWVLVYLTYTTPTVRDICTFAVLCSVSRPFCHSLLFIQGTGCGITRRNIKYSWAVRLCCSTYVDLLQIDYWGRLLVRRRTEHCLISITEIKKKLWQACLLYANVYSGLCL